MRKLIMLIINEKKMSLTMNYNADLVFILRKFSLFSDILRK